MRNMIGIMGGRLSDPINNEIQSFSKKSWKTEFVKAEQIGFEVLEWVFDLHENNPILDNDGVKEIQQVEKEHNILVNSLCADYFMHNKLFEVSSFELEKNLKLLKKLISQCHKIDLKILELPFIDSSSLKTEQNQNEIINNLEKILPIIEENNVILALETDLEPNSFTNLLSKINHPNVMANYDIGNSTAKNYDTEFELEILKPWIVNVHIKDRNIGGSTMPLGQGDVNFDLFFSTLKKINYSGDFVIQGAREDLDVTIITPESTCEKYFTFVKNYIEKYELNLMHYKRATN